MRFKNKAEFAKAIIEHGKLYHENGDVVYFDETKKNPFLINKEIPLSNTWNAHYNDWSTTPPLKDKDLVSVWDDCDSHYRIISFYDAINKCSFSSIGKRNGFDWQHYEKFEGEYPEWAKEAQKTLED